jgi:hypothetical protein
MSKKRLVYESPRARNLSLYGASGQAPLGICTSGYTPYPACSQGSFVSPAPYCTLGSQPDFGTECFAVGSSASNTCKTGSYA